MLSRLEEVTSKLTALEKALQIEQAAKFSSGSAPAWGSEGIQRLEMPAVEVLLRPSHSPEASSYGESSMSASWIDSYEDVTPQVDSWSLAHVTLSHSTAINLFKQCVISIDLTDSMLRCA